MADDTKTPAQVVDEIVKMLSNKLDLLKKEYSPAEAAERVRTTVVARITAHEAELRKMAAVEANGEKLTKNIGSLPSATPSQEEIADGNADKDRNVFTLLNKGEWAKGAKKPKAGKVIEAEGSGDLSKEALSAAAPPKAPKPPSLKPAGVPGAKIGQAPKAPKPPSAPGSTGGTMKSEIPYATKKSDGPTHVCKAPLCTKGIKGSAEYCKGHRDLEFHDANAKATAAGKKGVPAKAGDGVAKMDIPATTEAAQGGVINDTEKMEMPATSEKANGGPMPTKKMELPATSKKANGGPMPTKKMELPSTPEKANGGQMKKAAMPMVKSPVFNMKPKLGGKDPMSMDMTAAAGAAPKAMEAPKTVKLPSMEEHASRASQFNDFMPKGNFGKSEACSNCNTKKCKC
jgi:hypothetical protein